MIVFLLVAAGVVAGGTSRASALDASPNSVGLHSARGTFGPSDQYPTFKSLDGGMCLDVNMVDNARETWVPLTVWDCNFGSNQQFANNFPGSTTCCQLINQASQKCIDAGDPGNTGQLSNGQDVGVFPCKTGAPTNQNFNFVPPPSNTLGYAEIHGFQGKCIEIRVDPNNPTAQPARGTKIQLWDCNGQPWQMWKLFSL
jgi:hypothetical protein